MKCILVGVKTPKDRYDIEYSLDELQNLAEVMDYEVIGKLTQNLDSPVSKTYIGEGKLAELALQCQAYDADVVIINDELTPAQLRNISDYLNLEVIDRTFLILEIFEAHAMNASSKLEIKLTKDLYMLPRISSMLSKTERLSGAFNSRGSGETEREIRRRNLEAEINRIRNDLKTQKTMKSNQINRIKRNELPIVALVGYTNSGKSTTMNTILSETGVNEDKQVLSKNQLFATLQTFDRRISYNKCDFILVDTIGFVSKLPHHLVNSFYETLEEVKSADLIVHVLDTSQEYLEEQLNVVNDVLYALGCSKIPTIYLLNKWDINMYPNLSIPGAKSIYHSNTTKQGTKELLDAIYEEIASSTIHVKATIPYSKGNIVNIIEQNATIIKREYLDSGTYFEMEIPTKLYHYVSDYDMDTMVS